MLAGEPAAPWLSWWWQSHQHGASVRGHHLGNRLAGCCSQRHTMPRQLTGGVAWRWRKCLCIWKVAKLAPGGRKSQGSELRLLSFHLRGRCGLSGLVREGARVQESAVGAQTWPWLLSGSSAHIWAVPTDDYGCSQASLSLSPATLQAVAWHDWSASRFLSPVHDRRSEESLPKDVHWAHIDSLLVLSAIQAICILKALNVEDHENSARAVEMGKD